VDSFRAGGGISAAGLVLAHGGGDGFGALGAFEMLSCLIHDRMLPNIPWGGNRKPGNAG